MLTVSCSGALLTGSFDADFAAFLGSPHERLKEASRTLFLIFKTRFLGGPPELDFGAFLGSPPQPPEKGLQDIAEKTGTIALDQSKVQSPEF